jgi:hypothetical protein
MTQSDFLDSFSLKKSIVEPPLNFNLLEIYDILQYIKQNITIILEKIEYIFFKDKKNGLSNLERKINLVLGKIIEIRNRIISFQGAQINILFPHEKNLCQNILLELSDQFVNIIRIKFTYQCKKIIYNIADKDDAIENIFSS